MFKREGFFDYFKMSAPLPFVTDHCQPVGGFSIRPFRSSASSATLIETEAIIPDWHAVLDGPERLSIAGMSCVLR